VLARQGSGWSELYVHLPNAVATKEGTAWRYGAADGLGSVRQQLDSSGIVESVNSYRPFGLPLEGDGGDPYGFTGEWFEDQVELLFLRERYYDPYLNRFISPDTIVPDFSFPPSIHRYSYALNNPIRFVDPSGRQGTPYPPTPEATPQPRPTPPPLSTGTPTPQPADPQTSEWWSPYDPNWWSSPYEYDVARRHDPLFGNPYYYDPLYANDPVVSANFALWRSGAIGCWKCHVTHWRGRIPTNGELSAYFIDSWHCFDDEKALIYLSAMGLHVSQIRLAEGIIAGTGNNIGTYRAMQMPPQDDLDAHHILQDAWAQRQDIPGYNYYDAPAIRLAPPLHEAANDVQRVFRAQHGWNTTFQQELQLARDALQAAGVSIEEIDLAVQQAIRYFGHLGVR
jgi:RHS repeat-associated protein